MSVRRSNKKPEKQIKIARERINILFEKAEKEFGRNPEFSRRWVGMAKKIATRYNIRIPKELKRRFCRKCSRFLVPGENCRVRTSPKQQAVIVNCLGCGNIMRFPYRREKAARKMKHPKTA
jgi:ribonuclease P protein subunit RPR2